MLKNKQQEFFGEMLPTSQVGGEAKDRARKRFNSQ
jgi:hypothetical protein